MAIKYGSKVRELMIKEMEDIFKEENGFIFSSYNNIKSSDFDALRKKVKKSGSKYLIIKKKLGKIALEKTGYEGLGETLTMTENIGVTIVKDDPVSIAKLLMSFSKENKNFKVLNGCLEGNVLAADKVKELAELPSREQLLARVVGTMNAPITGFVGVLSSVLRSVCYALNAVKDKKESGN